MDVGFREVGPKQRHRGVEGLVAGDQATLARALTVLERGGVAAESLSVLLRPHSGHAIVVGFTGPPGAGKSTLISAYVAALRAEGTRVAVLAVDPSSPLSGGAVLGDRTRMSAHAEDPGVFIRSIASRGAPGGLARSIPAFIDAVDAAGWPVIVLETVGVGQAEFEVVEFADVAVLLSVPGLGDDIQALKAGILEVADILVVNKCDLPFADVTARQLRQMLALRAENSHPPPVISTNATDGTGVTGLADAIRARAGLPGRATAAERIPRRLRHQILLALEAEFKSRLACIESAALDELCASILVADRSLSDVVDTVISGLSPSRKEQPSDA